VKTDRLTLAYAKVKSSFCIVSNKIKHFIILIA